MYQSAIFKGKPRKSHILPIANKFKTKLATWKGSLLSIMGRVQSIKSIIHGMIVYCFHCYAWPKSLLKTIEGWIRNFIWVGEVNSRKLVIVSWKTLCSSFAEGGLELWSVRRINEAATLKLCWNLVTFYDQWSN